MILKSAILLWACKHDYRIQNKMYYYKRRHKLQACSAGTANKY